MEFKKINIILVSLVLFSFGIGIYFYPQMPEKMASHWNIKGEVDGYLSKFWGLFLMPIILIGVVLIYLIVPRIDPLKKNIEKFRKYFDGFIILLLLFLFYLYALTIFWNLGLKFDIGQAIIPALAILFYYCGILLEKTKRNWFIGIRTPWTLSNDMVWEKTHKIGGKLFKIAGIVAIFGIFFQRYVLFFILAPVILVAAYTIIYSYIEYRKEMK